MFRQIDIPPEVFAWGEEQWYEYPDEVRLPKNTPSDTPAPHQHSYAQPSAHPQPAKHLVTGCWCVVCFVANGVPNSPAVTHIFLPPTHPPTPAQQAVYKADTNPGGRRYIAAVRLANKTFAGRFDWLIVGDDDVIFFLDNLRDLLAKVNPDTPYLITDDLGGCCHSNCSLDTLSCSLAGQDAGKGSGGCTRHPAEVRARAPPPPPLIRVPRKASLHLRMPFSLLITSALRPPTPAPGRAQAPCMRKTLEASTTCRPPAGSKVWFGGGRGAIISRGMMNNISEVCGDAFWMCFPHADGGLRVHRPSKCVAMRSAPRVRPPATGCVAQL